MNRCDGFQWWGEFMFASTLAFLLIVFGGLLVATVIKIARQP